MATLKITALPDVLNGSVLLPASKSISNRVLIIKALQSDIQVENLSDAEDTVLLQQALANNDEEIYLGNAGTAMRFLLAYYTIRGAKKTLKGSPQMHERPIGILVDALHQLGAKINYLEKENYPPLSLSPSQIHGGEIYIDAGISSQYISALMLIAPNLPEGLKINWPKEKVSASYIKMTAALLQYFGASFNMHEDGININFATYQGKSILIESDWSSAAYMYAMVALMPGSDILLKGLGENSIQGDAAIATYLESFGVASVYLKNEVHIQSKGIYPEKFYANLIHTPDLIPTLVCLCVALEIPFKIEGISTLKYKETNRAEALKVELAKLGVSIICTENTMYYEGGAMLCTKEVILHTYSDHRLVMSFFLLAIKNQNILIDGVAHVNKSFPAFLNTISHLDFKYLTL